jgi:hypothetical protein
MPENQQTFGLLGGVIFEHTQSQGHKITAAPIMPKIKQYVTGGT